MRIFKSQLLNIFGLIALAAFLRFFLTPYLELPNRLEKLGISILILFFGAVYIIRGTAKVIEETTDVLKDRTRLAGGFLQSFGTAFPDMVLGIVAATLSLQARSVDYLRSVNLAIVAAATTFGSNIYNISYSIWCLARQNLADKKKKLVYIFPFLKRGKVKPMSQHRVKPLLVEFDTAVSVLSALSILTGAVALSMVIFGQVKIPPEGFAGSLYQLTRPVGIILLIFAILVLYRFRKNQRPLALDEEILKEEKIYSKQSTYRIWLDLFLSGIAILFAAESMIKAVETFCLVTKTPFVIAGALAGIIGCLGEMMTIHQFVTNPRGRIGDAVVGVAMDNIVTILGASVVAIIGGIFLGSSALILIFVIILTVNTLLIGQISKLKNNLEVVA
jgi:hypothetical protein